MAEAGVRPVSRSGRFGGGVHREQLSTEGKEVAAMPSMWGRRREAMSQRRIEGGVGWRRRNG